MRVKNIYVISLLLLVIILTSCSNEPKELVNVENTKSNKSITSDLNGNWETLCNYKNGISFIRNYRFSEPNYNYIESRYASSQDCSGIFSSYTQEGTFVIGNSVVSISGNTLTEIDFNYEENGQNQVSYNSIGIFDDSDTFYLGDTSVDSIANRPVDLNFDISFSINNASKILVTFFNDLNEVVTEIYVKLSDDKFNIEFENQISSPLNSGDSIKLYVFCGKNIDIRIKSNTDIVEERFSGQVQ